MAELFLDLSPAGFCDRSFQKCKTSLIGLINDDDGGFMVIKRDKFHLEFETPGVDKPFDGRILQNGKN